MTAAHHRRAAHALAGILVLAAATYAFGTVRDLEDWFYDGVVLGCVVLAAWRGAAVREDRAAWLLIALGLGAGSPATSGG